MLVFRSSKTSTCFYCPQSALPFSQQCIPKILHNTTQAMHLSYVIKKFVQQSLGICAVPAAATLNFKCKIIISPYTTA